MEIHLTELTHHKVYKVFGLGEFRKRVNSNRKHGTKLSPSELKSVIESYYDKIRDAIIFDNYDYKIPRTGYIELRKEKADYKIGLKGYVVGSSIDRAVSKTKGFRVLHENNHTNEYIYKFSIRRRMRLKNVNRFRFKAERYLMNRYLAKILKNKSKYGVVDAPLS